MKKSGFGVSRTRAVKIKLTLSARELQTASISRQSERTPSAHNLNAPRKTLSDLLFTVRLQECIDMRMPIESLEKT